MAESQINKIEILFSDFVPGWNYNSDSVADQQILGLEIHIDKDNHYNDKIILSFQKDGKRKDIPNPHERKNPFRHGVHWGCKGEAHKTNAKKTTNQQ